MKTYILQWWSSTYNCWNNFCDHSEIHAPIEFITLDGAIAVAKNIALPHKQLGKNLFQYWQVVDSKGIITPIDMELNCRCNRESCRKLLTADNICVHSQTGNYYCESCAAKINLFNEEIEDLILIPRKLLRKYYDASNPTN